MKKISIAILFLLSISGLFAETDTASENLSKYIGAGAGMTTGYGLSYRYWPKACGTQIVLTPIVSDDNITINIGTAALKALFNTKNTRLFLYLAGNGTYANYKEYTDSPIESEEAPSENVSNFSWAIGVGPGIEIYLFKNIAIDIMFGFGYGWGDSIINGLGFTAETALYYRFK